MTNFATCLRPSFTKRVVTYLEAGQSVNIYSTEEHGLKKLVEDIKKNCSPGDTCITISMRSYAHSFKGFLMALCDALNLKPEENNDVRTILRAYIDDHPGRIWLCLEDFDRLSHRTVDTKNVDVEGYDINFLNHLNSFRNIPRISLLLTSSNKLDTQELHIGGTHVRGSTLDISQRISLPGLDFQEIENFLKGMVSVAVLKNLKAQASFYNLLIREIEAHRASSEFAEYIADKIPTDAHTSQAEFEERLQYWKKEFDKNHAPSMDLRLSNISRDTSRWSDRAGRLVGIGKNIKTIHKKLMAFGAILTSIGVIYWNKVAEFFSWVLSFFK